MDREQLLVKAGSDDLRLLVDKTERVIRTRALANKQLKLIIDKQLDSGGKRLRPIILLMASAAKGRKIGSNHIKCAAAVELIHQASLLHDHVIDRETLSNENLSILAGDYLLAEGLALASEASSAAIRILANCIADMAAGQALQLDAGYRADPADKIYLKTARLKTASLFETACKLAAGLNCLGKKESEGLTGFGLAFGLAFQIIDDCVDGEFPAGRQKPAVRAAGNYISSAKKSLVKLPDGPAKIGLVRLADAYMQAALP
jgi:geranylgeranyl pyrophosphate synthase